MRILEVTTEHTAPFKTLIEVLKDMLPETNIEFHADPDYVQKNRKNKNTDEEDDEEDNKKNKKDRGGMRIMAVDTSKTLLINLQLKSSNFETYICREKKIVVGVDLVKFYQLIKTMDKNDVLTLYMDKGDLNLKIKIDNKEENKESVIHFKTYELKEENLAVPDPAIDAVVSMNSGQFHKICRDMTNIAEWIDIQIAGSKIIFACKGDFASKKTILSTGADNEDVDDETESDDKRRKDKQIAGGVNISWNPEKKGPVIVQGIYEGRNLNTFSKFQSLCADILIFVKNDYPLILCYEVATLGKIILCVAPKIDDEKPTMTENDAYYKQKDIKMKK